jgi:hypothetical protein
VRFCPDRYGTDPERLMYAHGYTTGHAPVCLCVVMNARTNVNAPSMSAHELHNAVTAAAETDGVSFGAWVRRACEERLARQRAQRPSVTFTRAGLGTYAEPPEGEPLVMRDREGYSYTRA